jgi:hypothetical protein
MGFLVALGYHPLHSKHHELPVQEKTCKIKVTLSFGGTAFSKEGNWKEKYFLNYSPLSSHSLGTTI